MDDLLSEIETFLKAHDLSPTRFGLMAANDRRLVHQMREGRELRRATVEKVRTLMLTYTPERQAA